MCVWGGGEGSPCGMMDFRLSKKNIILEKNISQNLSSQSTHGNHSTYFKYVMYFKSEKVLVSVHS